MRRGKGLNGHVSADWSGAQAGGLGPLTSTPRPFVITIGTWPNIPPAELHSSSATFDARLMRLFEDLLITRWREHRRQALDRALITDRGPHYEVKVRYRELPIRDA